VKGGETCLDGGLMLAPAPGSTVPGTEIAAMERPKGVSAASDFRRFRGSCGGTKTKARLSALRLPSKSRGEKLTAHLARRRGNASAWLFEAVDRKFDARRFLTSPRLRGEVEAGAQRRLRVRGTLRKLDSWRLPLTRLASNDARRPLPASGARLRKRAAQRPGNAAALTACGASAPYLP
jgi:hypothetical protein